MTVYVVITGEYSDQEVFGIYTDGPLARLLAEQLDPADVVAIELDDFLEQYQVGLLPFRVEIAVSVDKIVCYPLLTRPVRDDALWTRIETDRHWMKTQVWAKSVDEAIDLARQRLQEHTV